MFESKFSQAFLIAYGNLVYVIICFDSLCYALFTDQMQHRVGRPIRIVRDIVGLGISKLVQGMEACHLNNAVVAPVLDECIAQG